MVVVRIRDPGKAKVADFEVTVRVDQQVGRLQVAVEDVGRVDVLQASEKKSSLIRHRFHLFSV